MAKKFPIEVADTCGALKFKGIPTKEIHRRLTKDEAGLGYKLDVSLRRVYEYVADYERRHGPPPEPEGDSTVESIQAVKDRIVALVAREVRHYETKRKGKVTKADVALLESFHTRLMAMERRELIAEKRLPLNKVAVKDRPGARQQPPREESFIEKLRRQEDERLREQAECEERPIIARAAPPMGEGGELSIKPPPEAYTNRDEAA